MGGFGFGGLPETQGELNERFSDSVVYRKPKEI